MNTTHLLACTHCIGPNSTKHYYMHCNILKTMPDGRLKIEVFGERNWKGKEHIRKVRYVPPYRVTRRSE